LALCTYIHGGYKIDIDEAMEHCPLAPAPWVTFCFFEFRLSAVDFEFFHKPPSN
jgi:hypothetical protein